MLYLCPIISKNLPKVDKDESTSKSLNAPIHAPIYTYYLSTFMQISLTIHSHKQKSIEVRITFWNWFSPQNQKQTINTSPTSLILLSSPVAYFTLPFVALSSLAPPNTSICHYLPLSDSLFAFSIRAPYMYRSV